MGAKTLSATALKTWALVLIINGLISVTAIVAQFLMARGEGDTRPWLIGGYWNTFSLALVVLAGVLVLKNGDSLAEWAVGANDESLTSSSIDLERVAFGTLGVYFLVQGLRRASFAGFELATRPAFDREGLAYLWQNQPRLILDGAVEFIAGLVLILGRRGLAKMWKRLRSGSSMENASDPSA